MIHEFKTQRRVEFADTDSAGILHFANYLRYMEEVEHAFFRSLGLSVRTPTVPTTTQERAVIGYPRVSVHCEYARAVRFEDVLDVHLWVSDMGRKTIRYAGVFSHGGEEVARAEVVVMSCRVVEGESIESIPLPDEVREKLEKAPYSPLTFRSAPETRKA